MDDDEIVKDVLQTHWFNKRYALTRDNFMNALETAINFAREDEHEKHLNECPAEDE